ncbi:DUF4333 domain-containing protein [Streptomyces synnematoformans]|uniref:DUF4333 domain-containing protein n=1 Tax=Streptomyces synnematoformans TaxID=415721 RepID=A0ABN2X7G0_9ACTN
MRRAVSSRILTGATAGVLAVLLSAGCSVSVGSSSDSMSKEDVAEKASEALAKEVGRQPDDVTCEDDLKAEVGATVRCELTDGGTKVGVTVTAKSVDGDTIRMDVKADDAPKADPSASPAEDGSASPGTGGASESVPSSEVERQGRTALAAQVGREPDSFHCPQDLPARVNATVRCVLGAESQQWGVTVTATSVAGDTVQMDFKVDSTPMS